MQPPVCAICGKNFTGDPDGGDLVQFTPTPEERRAMERPKPGPSIAADWFCTRHLAPARALVHLTLAEAMRTLRGPGPTTPPPPPRR